MLTIRPITPTHVPLQPLFIPCTWHTKSLLLHPNVFVSTTHSYVYVAFSITTRLVHCILVHAYFRDTILFLRSILSLKSTPSPKSTPPIPASTLLVIQPIINKTAYS